ncbi:hypothetical protein ABDK96_11800 [Citricoccus nitrophenolicus]|uniref:Uncharacterized protein n=1 Tax=Citricoccus nitrophenolicus TaxID=863575 RepID=A0ABV0IJN6_9MICC|nr:hypothetical protein [Citricoccus sp. I39-566]WMY79682.1 hypothetical protein RE421_07505 [Citricoccus sp. I39-566]
MYGATENVAASGVAATALAATGLDVFWIIVSGVAFIMAGIVLTRLRPKEEF